LLWNVLLTLDAGHPKSHKRSEWPLFTDAVMGVLSEKKSPLVFLSFGRDSHRYAPRFIFPAHKIIKTSHPSPLGAYKHAKDGSFRAFLGSNCFYETNQFLSHNGLHPIHWGN
jgi:uracil-DNA glycosylase